MNDDSGSDESTNGSTDGVDHGAAPEEAADPTTVIVGVGASAGGLDAFRRFLQAVPDDSGLVFVLAQHLDPTHESLMASLLSKYTQMPVQQVERPTPVAPNHVYMLPPNKYIRYERGQLHLDDAVQVRGVRMPIDHLFRSLAANRGRHAACVVLSGTGTDGTLGLADVKAAGGITLAQRPETAEYDGMPRSAVNSGRVDHCLEIEAMPQLLVRYARHPYATRASARFDRTSPHHFRAIVSLLRAHTDCDFGHYKTATLNRRIERRMGLREVETADEYLGLLRRDPDEIRALFKDMLIGVTRFFRDKPAWEQLEEDVLRRIIASKSPEESVRVWVPGCSTGEEAYSLSISLLEQFEATKTNGVGIQVFGTDLDAEAIDVARMGVYTANIVTDVSQDRLRRFFRSEGDLYSVKKRVRESCVFAVQNLISDPPFSNLDLISCRNLLIYLDNDTQEQLLQRFHFALAPNGFLFLGSSESISRGEAGFEVVSPKWRMYRRTRAPRRAGAGLPLVERTEASTPRTAAATRRERGGTVEQSRKALLEQFVPASVVVNQRHEIQYFHGDLRNYIHVPSGEPTVNLVSLVAEGLRSKLRGLLRQCTVESSPVSGVARRVSRGATTPVVDVAIRVHTASAPSESLLVVSFSDLPPRPPEESEPTAPEDEAPVPASSSMNELVEQLEYELQATRQDLHGTIEELETSNEELKASNEEVMSMNEELQSTNEELETSREELQSLNEELATVNSQLEEKLFELEGTNNDLSNLLSSTEIATLFLDTNLCIRRFTPACSDLLHILASDVGRPISDLAPRVEDPNLLSDARQVLADLGSVDQEVTNAQGSSFARRIRPYRTSDNAIQGVVVTFTDITRISEARLRVELREAQQAAVARLGRIALSSRDPAELFQRAVELVSKTLNVPLAKVLKLHPDRTFVLVAGVGWKPGLVGKARVPAGIESQAGYTLEAHAPVVVQDTRREKRFRPPELLIEHGVVSGMSIGLGPQERPWGVLGVHTAELRRFEVDDINFLEAFAHVISEFVARVETDAELHDRDHRLQLVADAVPVLLSYVDRDSIYRYCNSAYREWFGVGESEIVGASVKDVIGAEARAAIEPYVRGVLAGERQDFETQLELAAGPRTVRARFVPHALDDGSVAGYYALVEDIGARREADAERRRLAAIMHHAHDAIVGATLDGRITSWNLAAQQMYGYGVDEAMSLSLNQLAPESFRAEMQASIERAASGHEVGPFDTVQIDRDGKERAVVSTISPIVSDTNEVVGISLIARDITQRVAAERRLEEWANTLEEIVIERTAAAERRSRDLRAMIEYISENDSRLRRRASVTIRDEVQPLIGVARKGLAELEQAQALDAPLDRADDQCRGLLSALEPVLPENRGLGDAIAALATGLRAESGLTVAFTSSGALDGLLETTKMLVYEAAWVLLDNVVKHAGVANATMSLDVTDEAVELTVADEGRGFEFNRERIESSGPGLLGLFGRVAGRDGDVRVDARVGAGTTVRVAIPLRSTPA